MRAKIVVSVSVLALAVLAPAVYFHSKSGEPAPVAEPVASDDSTNAAAVPAILHRIAGPTEAQSSVPGQQDPAADMNSPEHEEYAKQRKADLYQMGVSRDPGSLKAILIEVHNVDPEIRESALTAIKDFDSKDAIPSLQNELKWAEDPREKVQIQDAIDFLNLPTLTLGEKGMITGDSSGQ